MIRYLSKPFRNTALTPLRLTFLFAVDTQLNFGKLHFDDKIIGVDLRTTSFRARGPLASLVKLEAMRMLNYARETFVGKTVRDAMEHNGVVPAPSYTERFAGMPPELGMGYGARYHSGGPVGLAPGEVPARLSARTIFPLRCAWDFSNLAAKVVEKNPNLDPTFPHIVRERTPRAEVEAAIQEHREAYPETSQLFQELLDAVPHYGNELPPKVGERYFSVVNNSVYTVLHSERKKYRESDYDITMERDGDGHRTKFTFRSHADWLVTWRPVDHEGEARETVQVDLAEIEQQEAAHAAEKMVDAERQMHVLRRELSKRLPGWDEAPKDAPVFLDECALMIRAIRHLARSANEAREETKGTVSEYMLLHDRAQMLERERNSMKNERDVVVRQLEQMPKAGVYRQSLIDAVMIAKYVLGVPTCKGVIIRTFGNYTPVTQLSDDELAHFVRALRDEAAKKLP